MDKKRSDVYVFLSNAYYYVKEKISKENIDLLNDYTHEIMYLITRTVNEYHIRDMYTYYFNKPYLAMLDAIDLESETGANWSSNPKRYQEVFDNIILELALADNNNNIDRNRNKLPIVANIVFIVDKKLYSIQDDLSLYLALRKTIPSTTFEGFNEALQFVKKSFLKS